MIQKYKFNIKAIAMALIASFSGAIAIAQPVIKVPPACTVVVTGTGTGVTLGPGGIVGSGGVIEMPDPVIVPSVSFTYIPNGTTQTGWGLQGDLSVYPNPAPYAHAIQSAVPGPLEIMSYNENVRPSEGAGGSTPTLARSKGRVTVGYAASGCGNASISFDVYKTYNGPGSGPNYVPPIVGPSCWSPSTTVTYSVDQIASDNLPDAIGLDKYYWTIHDALGIAPVIGAYSSADSSSITFTTPLAASFNPPFTMQVCYGRANKWDGSAGGPHVTCVTLPISSVPTAPAFSPAIPSCVSTGIHSFSATYTPTAGYTYAWTTTNSTWILTPGTGSLVVSSMDDNPSVLTLTVTGPCLPAQFTYTVNRTFSAAETSIAGPSCVTAGGAYTFSLTSTYAVLNNITTWSAPAGWTVTADNGAASVVGITVPGGTVAGAYTVSATSSSCPGVITATVNVTPSVPTGVNGPSCVTRNSGPTETYTCNPVPGAAGYSWNLPAGWACISGCNTVDPVFQPGGTSAGPVDITVVADGTGGCNSVASAPFAVNYSPVTPSGISVGCFNFGTSGFTNITVGSAPVPFYGTYNVTASPVGLFTATPTVSGSGVITMNTLATASGVYTLTISHVTGSCGSATATYTVNVASNGASIIAIYNPGAGYSDTYIETGAPVSSSYTWTVGVITTTVTTSSLVLSSTVTPTGDVCVFATYPALTGCTTETCVPVGTHGYTMVIHPGAGNDNIQQIFADQIKIFPNPNSGIFKVNMPTLDAPATMQMIDASGKKVGNYTLQSGENSIIQKGLSPGLYYLIVKSDGNVATFKIEILKE